MTYESKLHDFLSQVDPGTLEFYRIITLLAPL